MKLFLLFFCSILGVNCVIMELEGVSDNVPPPIQWDSHREVADMPELPSELSQKSSTDWLMKALDKTTTVMLVWKRGETFKSEEYSAPKLSETIMKEIPDVVAQTVKKATEDSSGPFPLKNDAISKIVQDGVHLKVTQLNAVGQTHIRGVPQVSAQEVVDYVSAAYKDFVDFAEVDTAISMRDFMSAEMASERDVSDDHRSHNMVSY